MGRGLILTTAAGLVSPEDAFAFFNIMNHRKKRLRLTISTNTMNFNLRSALQAAGWSFSAAPSTSIDITLIINSGIYVWSNSVGTPAIDATNLPAGSVIRLFNNGYVLGQGGAGGGYNMPNGVNGQSGGNAINTDAHMIIDNQNGYICGGGGGGGGVFVLDSYVVGGGGGAGGGAGGSALYIDTNDNQYSGTGGSGGGLGNSGSSGVLLVSAANGASTGGGGGRVVPGSSTAGPTFNSTIGRGGFGGSAGGAGSIRTIDVNNDNPIGTGTQGGSGGGAETLGGSGVVPSADTLSGSYRIGAGGGGGGWGRAGGMAAHRFASFSPTNGTGGAAGKAINTNGKSIIWIGGSASSGRAYGLVS